MNPFTYERRRDRAARPPRARPSGRRQVPRRRHQPPRPDEARRRAPRPRWSTSTACRSTSVEARRRAACASARWCATATWPTDPRGRDDYPLLAEALLAGASPQLRNMATTGGNLLQRTRCYYFHDTGLALQQARTRAPAAPRIDGFNRIHAILGTSDVHRHPPVRHGVALAALDAVVQVDGPERAARRSRSPSSTACPATRRRSRHVLAHRRAHHGRRPARRAVGRACTPTVKVRDRASYAFALVSAPPRMLGRRAAWPRRALALGGVAHKPWRVAEAEASLRGQPPAESLPRGRAGVA